VLEAVVMGLVQGLTEFLPVSSSGHLTIVPYLLDWEQPPLAFDVALHAATLLAVVAYFAGDLWSLLTRSLGRGGASRAQTRQARTTVGLLALASVPAAAFGLLLEETFEETFSDPRLAAVFLFVTAAVLLGAEAIHKRRAAAAAGVGPDELSDAQARADLGRDVSTTGTGDALAMGFAQAAAIFPGVSRSGATIAAGMARGLSREGAARFSFLLSIPVIAGAFVLKLPDLTGSSLDASVYGGGAIIAGMVAAAVSGYWAIRFLLALVVGNTLRGFAVYVVAFGLFTLAAALLWLGAPA
jgi:undecaprenyl-diphosphatase